jgi:hypothetical protein
MDGHLILENIKPYLVADLIKAALLSKWARSVQRNGSLSADITQLSSGQPILAVAALVSNPYRRQ